MQHDKQIYDSSQINFEADYDFYPQIKNADRNNLKKDGTSHHKTNHLVKFSYRYFVTARYYQQL